MVFYVRNLDKKQLVGRATYALQYFAQQSLRNSGVAQLYRPLLRWSFAKSVNISVTRKYKLAYQAIPKNASTTLLNWQLMLDGILKPGETKGHSKIPGDTYIQSRLLNNSDWRNYRHFTFVRNPFARMVSDYSYRRAAGVLYPRYDASGARLKDYSFEYHVRAVCNTPNHMRDIHLRTQQSLLHFPMLDFIGRIENFSDDMRKIIDRYQLPPESYDLLPHLKKGGYGDYREYYNEVTRKLVEKHYRKDLDTFGYSF